MVEKMNMKQLILEFLIIRPLLMLIGIFDKVVDYFKYAKTIKPPKKNAVLSKLTDETNPSSAYR